MASGDSVILGRRLSEVTSAYVGRNSTLTIRSDVAAERSSLTVEAADETSMISVAGSLAIGGTAGIGVGADVGVYTKRTTAYIDSGVTADVEGDIVVDAESSESLTSVAAGVGISAGVGVAVDAGVRVFNLTTLAFIGDDPSDQIPSAGAGNVHAHGSIVLSANDRSDVNEIVGVLAAGEVGIGAAAGVNVMNKNTEAFIGAGANVSGDGAGAGLTVATGRIDIGIDSAAARFDPSRPNDQGIHTDDASTLTNAKSGDRSTLRNQGHVNTPILESMNLKNDGTKSQVDDPSLNGERRASLGSQAAFHGVAVTATNRDELRTFTISVAGGLVGVAVSAGVDVVNVTTKAYIGDKATVNASTANADPSQSVLIGAGDDFYHLAVAATLGVGIVGVAPAVGVNVVNNITSAFIGDGTTVNATNDVVVEATGKEDFAMIGIGLGGGLVGVGGVVNVLMIDNHTNASIGNNATVFAEGDVFVSATDDTHVLELSGALAVGLVGVGGSVGVMDLTKETQAIIGQNARVDALGYGAGVAGVLDGGIDNGAFRAGSAHGVIVQATSSEDILHIVATGGFGFVGVSGAVGVTTLNLETDAIIGAGALINRTHPIDEMDPFVPSSQQSISVNAGDKVSVRTFIVGVAGGFVGVSGAVDVGTLNSNIKAEVQAGAGLSAAGNIAVHAVGIQDIASLTASGAGGFVGVGGAVSVWSIGTQLEKTYTDSDGNTQSAVAGSNGKNADDDAARQAEKGTGEVTHNLGSFDRGGSNRNTSTARVADASQSANNSIAAKGPTQARLTASENRNPVPPGTSAVIRAGAESKAGGNITVTATESVTLNALVGQISGGVVGAGASVGVLSLANNVVIAHPGVAVGLPAADVAASVGL